MNRNHRNHHRNHQQHQICPYFLDNRCLFGTACNFSHDVYESRAAIARPVQQSHVRHSPQTCRNFVSGYCRFGRNCKYYHPPQQQPQPLHSSNGRFFNQSKPMGIPGHSSHMSFQFSPDVKPFVPRGGKNASDSPSYSNWNKEGDEEEDASCPYWVETGECHEENCPLIHGLKECDLCHRFCLHPTNEFLQKAHKHNCVQEHEQQMKEAFAIQLSKDKTCGICMENIWEQAQRFGILNKCKHCYCLRCIRSWRKATGPMQKEAIRSCPQCRIVSDFVIPSEQWVEEDTEKEALIQQYQQNMKQKVCKYVKNDSAEECPFGNKCFYRHQRRDGSLITTGPPRRRRRSPSDYQNLSLEEFIRIVPNVNLIRVGVGEEESIGYLLEEFPELFEAEISYGDYPTSDEYDDDPYDIDDLDGLDEELFEFQIDQSND